MLYRPVRILNVITQQHDYPMRGSGAPVTAVEIYSPELGKSQWWRVTLVDQLGFGDF